MPYPDMLGPLHPLKCRSNVSSLVNTPSQVGQGQIEDVCRSLICRARLGSIICLLFVHSFQKHLDGNLDLTPCLRFRCIFMSLTLRVSLQTVNCDTHEHVITDSRIRKPSSLIMSLRTVR